MTNRDIGYAGLTVFYVPLGRFQTHASSHYDWEFIIRWIVGGRGGGVVLFLCIYIHIHTDTYTYLYRYILSQIYGVIFKNDTYVLVIMILRSSLKSTQFNSRPFGKIMAQYDIYFIIKFDYSGPFAWYRLPLITAMIENYIHYKVWHEIIYPFPNFSGCTTEVLEWISNLSHMLQSVINTASPLVTKTRKFGYITPVLQDPQWLPVESRSKFKILFLV